MPITFFLFFRRAAAGDASTLNDAMSSRSTEDNSKLAGKDIGTQMAHMVEIELPDF